jgi:hypothetical protein
MEGMEAVELSQKAHKSSQKARKRTRKRTRTARMTTRRPNQGIAVSLGNLHLARGVHGQGVNQIVNAPLLVLTKLIWGRGRHRGIH